jgi:tRNA(Ile)-lysidine synthase
MSLVAKLAGAWPTEQWNDVTVLVAVSGGADSVALARALAEMRTGDEGGLVLAHFNHRLRGAESDADEVFVGDLAGQLGLRLLTGGAATNLAAGGSGEGIEGAARKARYDFLSWAASQCGARYVATAHTADDNVETVLFNILRGTGLLGLAGIPRVRNLTDSATIIRPLLDVTRTEVLDYLQSLGQWHRDDSTNRVGDYTRNRIRHELLPLLEHDYNPRVRDAILRLAQIAGETRDLIRQSALELLEKTLRRQQDGVVLDIGPLQGAPPSLIRSALVLLWQEQGWPLQDMSLEKWEQLRALIQTTPTDASPAIQMFPGGIRAERRGDALRLSHG